MSRTSNDVIHTTARVPSLLVVAILGNMRHHARFLSEWLILIKRFFSAFHIKLCIMDPPAWRLETEDWSPRTILAQNRGPAANESRTSDGETTRPGQIGMAVTSGNSCTCTSPTSSWRLKKKTFCTQTMFYVIRLMLNLDFLNNVEIWPADYGLCKGIGLIYA